MGSYDVDLSRTKDGVQFWLLRFEEIIAFYAAFSILLPAIFLEVDQII